MYFRCLRCTKIYENVLKLYYDYFWHTKYMQRIQKVIQD